MSDAKTMMNTETQQTIKDYVSSLYKECFLFLESLDITPYVRIDEQILLQAVTDYFTELSPVEEADNEAASLALEAYWLLRRKPLQVLEVPDDREFWSFLNEKFVLTRIVSFLSCNPGPLNLDDSSRTAFFQYLDILYDFLKYNNYDAKTLELIILSFHAGRLI
nr:hypothetical protein [uncultured Sellimonas sp.]